MAWLRCASVTKLNCKSNDTHRRLLLLYHGDLLCCCGVHMRYRKQPRTVDLSLSRIRTNGGYRG
jgi:hypothetical protein